MISINNLDFAYSKKEALFDQLSIDLQTGKIYGLLGKNGTGKSTLLKLICGVLFPRSGGVEIDGSESSARKVQTLHNIFFLSEDYLLPSVSATKYSELQRPFYPNFDEGKFYQILDTFELSRTKNLSKMSFGQKKKYLIAFGIACNTKYLLLDEPTNGLDIPSKAQFRTVMASGFLEDQLVIISTHQIRDLSKLIDSIIIIENGRIIFSQDVFEVEKKILFTKSMSLDKDPDALYSELTPEGCIQLNENTEGHPSDLELEVLFNAVLDQQSAINNLF